MSEEEKKKKDSKGKRLDRESRVLIFILTAAETLWVLHGAPYPVDIVAAIGWMIILFLYLRN